MIGGSGSKKQAIESAAVAARDSTEKQPPRPVQQHPAAAPSKTSGIPSLPPKTPAAAPLTIVAPAELRKQMKELWEKSFVDGKSRQQGGIIARDVSGKLSLVNTGGGASYIFHASRKVQAEHKMVGVFHTRPFDRSEGGQANVSLSGSDAEYLISHGDEIVITQSGESQFMYLRTEEAAKCQDAAGIDAKHCARVSQLVSQGKSFDEASRIAARDTAVENGLAYYEGKDGEFRRVAP